MYYTATPTFGRFLLDKPICMYGKLFSEKISTIDICSPFLMFLIAFWKRASHILFTKRDKRQSKNRVSNVIGKFGDHVLERSCQQICTYVHKYTHVTSSLPISYERGIRVAFVLQSRSLE